MTTEKDVKIHVKGLKKSFGHVHVLKGIDAEIKAGEVICVIGPSGSGKSTIARMLTHLEPVTDGQIFLKGKDITHARGKTLRDIYQDIQMVFQMPMESFDPRRTLGDGIGESLRNMGISRRETRERVENLLEKCGLEKEFAERIDLVIYDTPPLLGFTDAQILAGREDGTIFVVHYGVDTKEEVMKASESLKMVNANVLGVVYNRVPGGQKEHSYYYGYKDEE